MNEKQTKSVRPTKKQRELLQFIQQFIGEHGYSPSYREIMNGLHYTSVATVALHVGNLIKRGHLRKRDRSARSLEVVDTVEIYSGPSTEIAPTEEKWLIQKVEQAFREVEESDTAEGLDNLYVLVGALKVLGLNGAVTSFVPRITALKEKATG